VTVTTCAPGPYRSDGCGHPLADHTDGLRCRICGVECGIAPRARGDPPEVEPEPEQHPRLW
jgi:hypothetical protein